MASSSLCACKFNSCQLSRLVPVHSPVLTVFHDKTPLNITLDCGATVSFIVKNLCLSLGLDIKPNGQLIKLGDGCTTLASVGEIDTTFIRDKWKVRFRAIVVDQLNSQIFGGMTFLCDNDISFRATTGEIKILNKHVVFQTNTLMQPPQLKAIVHTSKIIKFPKNKVIPPQLCSLWDDLVEGNPDLKKEIENFISIKLPSELHNLGTVIIKPRHENKLQDWPPMQLKEISNNGCIVINNDTERVVQTSKDVRILEVMPTCFIDSTKLLRDCYSETDLGNINLSQVGKANARQIDVSRAPKHLQIKLTDAHTKFSKVFEPDLSLGYNGFSGSHFVRLHFADENRPQMNKCKIPRWAGKNDALKQRKMDSLEQQGVLIDPYKLNIRIKMVSPSFLRVKARAKEKDIEDCDLSEIRWIISPSQLNPHLRQLQTKNVTKEDLFIFKSEKPYCIEFDLYEGYFQNHIHKDDWGYLAVETPFKGLRVLTRSGQGLLNQEIEMNQLLTKILGAEIEKGNVIIQADDGQVGGKTFDEAVENWISVLNICTENNIKLTPKKIKIFPSSSLIHGWVFKDGCVQPDPHRRLALLDMKTPRTVGELRTYMGVYKTFFPAMPQLSNLMSPFETLCGNRNSKELLEWNDSLENNFKMSKIAAEKNLRTLALPHPYEQLFIVPDAACKDTASKAPAIGFILFVQRNSVAQPVMFLSWRMGESYWSWTPCELEALGASIAVDKCAFFILRSDKPTLVFPDNKQVIQAFRRLKKGRYSTSQRLATFTNRMQKYPIEMQHGSGKLLQNIGSDYVSRNPPDCTDSKCSVCIFANERGELLLSALNTQMDPELDLSNIRELTLNSAKEIPIGNTKAWYNLQINDPAISEAINYRKTGQQPPKTGTFSNEIKFYVRKCTLSPKTQLLVKEEEIPYETKKIERIVIPKIFLEPLLTQIHHDQSCPTVNQMKKLYGRYFYAYEPGNIFEQITSNCKICQSNKILPKEIKHFSSVTNASCPGTFFVIDVMNRAKQSIIVCRDAFSDFVTTSILKSEKVEDLKEGLVAVTSAVRKNAFITIKTDNAPGFKSMHSKDQDLSKLGITLELSDVTNKNGVAIVDKAIQELEKEIRIVSPESQPLSSSELARATLALNSRIRNRSLSAYEIMFSREQTTGSNIALDDKELSGKKFAYKQINHGHSEKSKFHKAPESKSAKAERGDFVHIKTDGSKHKSRELYLVSSADRNKASLVKVMHSLEKKTQTKLSSTPLEVPQTEIYVASKHNSPSKLQYYTSQHSSDETTVSEHPKRHSIKKQWCPVQDISSSDDSSESDRESSFDIGNQISSHCSQDSLTPDTCDTDIMMDALENSDEVNIHSETSHLPSSPVDPARRQIIIDYSEEPVQPEQLLQDSKPKVNDVIAFYHGSKKTWVRATLLSNELRGHKNYYNIKYDTGKLDGLYLIKGERWTFLGDSELPAAPSLGGEFSYRNQHDQYPVNLSQVHYLDNVLPLPFASFDENIAMKDHRDKRRIQHIRPRGLLPMELSYANQLSSAAGNSYIAGTPRNPSSDVNRGGRRRREEQHQDRQYHP